MDRSPDELERWLGEHGPALVLYARQWVRCHADAEDVFHDAFVRFWPQRDRARDPVAYLYRCVRNAAMDWGRSPQRRESELDTADTDLLAAKTDGDANDERREQLESALTQLPDEQREVLVMKHYGGLTFDSIATALDIPLRTAQSRHRYAIERMRALLTESTTP